MCCLDIIQFTLFHLSLLHRHHLLLLHYGQNQETSTILYWKISIAFLTSIPLFHQSTSLPVFPTPPTTVALYVVVVFYGLWTYTCGWRREDVDGRCANVVHPSITERRHRTDTMPPLLPPIWNMKFMYSMKMLPKEILFLAIIVFSSIRISYSDWLLLRLIVSHFYFYFCLSVVVLDLPIS